MRIPNYLKISSLSLILIACAEPAEKNVMEDKAMEEIIETIDAPEKVEEREAAIQDDMQLLDEAEKEAVVETIKKAEEKRAEKLSESDLKPYAGDAEGLIAYIDERIAEAKQSCDADGLEAFIKKTSDDLIFRAIYDDDAYYEEIDALFIRARAVIDSCRNP